MVVMIEQIQGQIEALSTSTDIHAQYISIILRTDEIDLRSLIGLNLSHNFYFKDGKEELIGIGSVKQLSATGFDRFNKVEKEFADLKESIIIINPDNIDYSPRLVGGFTFNLTQSVTIWNQIPPASLILPKFLFVRSGDDNFCVISGSSFSAIIDELNELRKEIARSSDSDKNTIPNKVEHIEYPIDKRTWKSTINKAHELMDNGELEKVVLSRVTEIKTRDRINPVAVMQRLNLEYPNCYQFMIQPAESTWFYGASPELLCEIKGSNLNSIALAGTYRRGSNLSEDREYSEQLMSSVKDRYEHQLVVDSIVNHLKAYTETIEHEDDPSILQLSNVIHLKTGITGKLDHDSTIFDILSVLHPTPALGGIPRETAIQFIRDHESHPRGLYASPVGWIDLQGNGKMIVAIRSAITKDNLTWLYAGAGIVRQSDAELEWDEIELKFKPIMKALEVKL